MYICKVKTLGVFILLLLTAASVAAQGTSVCPNLSIVGPAGITTPGDTAIFSLNPNLSNFENLKFNWTVSAGTIVTGVGSPVITAQTTQENAGTSLVASVTVSGLPSHCPNTATAVAPVFFCGLPAMLDEFGKLTPSDERARLDAAAAEWSNNPTFYLFFVITSPAKESRASSDARVARIKRHLSVTRKIPPDRLVFTRSVFDQLSIKIYMVPPDAKDAFYDSQNN